jgi:hypothetical protein
MFPDYVEFARANQTLDQLVQLKKSIQSHADSGNVAPYFEELSCHQEAFFSMFTQIFQSKATDPASAIDLVGKHNWRFFKYTGLTIDFDKFVLIPYYHNRFKEHFNRPCFSGDEMQVAMENQSEAMKILDEKKKALVYLSGIQGNFIFTPLYERNIEIVRDWTGRLSYEK